MKENLKMYLMEKNPNLIEVEFFHKRFVDEPYYVAFGYEKDCPKTKRFEIDDEFIKEFRENQIQKILY